MAGPDCFLFKRRNYFLILIAVILIITGLVLMSGNSNQGGSTFNNEIYSARRITWAPLILVSGYALIIYAIISVKKIKQNG